MPRYFFQIYNDVVTHDEEGAELPDLDAARARAVREVRILAAESVQLHGHLVLGHRIEVEERDGTKVATVRFGDVVRITI